MRRHPPYCDVDGQTGNIVAVLGDRTVGCEVPRIFGDVRSAEVRGDYIVAHTAQGKASFHATSGLIGKMPWHAMVKAFQDLCLMGSLSGRVKFHITHHRYKSGGNSRDGVAGRILIDGEIVYKGIGYPGPDEFEPRALGSALATYLNLTLTSALESDNPMVRALALLDHRLSDAEFLALAEPPYENPLWRAFHRLRGSTLRGNAPHQSQTERSDRGLSPEAEMLRSRPRSALNARRQTMAAKKTTEAKTAAPKAAATKTAAPKKAASSGAGGPGTRDNPWQLKTPPGTSEFEAFRDEAADALVVRVGKTELRYQLRCIEDLKAMLIAHGDWMPLGGADEQKPAPDGSVEAWGRSGGNPVGGWYGTKKGLRGRFGVYVPPVLEALGLAEVEHNPKNNRMRAQGK